MTSERAELYQSAYLADYGFERVMVHYRRLVVLERLSRHRPDVVVEIGCGSELLYDAWRKGGGNASCWVTVEPASQFASLVRASGLPNFHLVDDFFEQAIDRVNKILPRKPDMIICSGLLHEVPSAIALLRAIYAVMGEATQLHINVPNAGSLHRRLAHTMGLITDTRAMSERNISLMQHRVYDLPALHADLAEAGLRVIESGGFLIKPFTHAQMEQLTLLLGEPILDGLFELGRELPELSSEIWVEAVQDGHG